MEFWEVEDMYPVADPKKRVKKRWIILTAVLIGLIAAAALFLRGISLELILNGEETVVLDYGTEFADPGASLSLRFPLIHNAERVEGRIRVSGDLDTDRVGNYRLRYTAEFGFWQAEAVRNIQIVDRKSPEISLLGEPELQLMLGTSYEEPGFMAADEYDGDLSHRVEVTGEVDTSREGTYVLTYTVKDTAGNTASVKRTVICVDSCLPQIVLEGDKTMHIQAGAGFTEPGYRADDNSDGDLTHAVEVTGEVDPYHAGTYVLTYCVSDSSGNTASVTRTVIVDAAVQPEIIRPDEKVIYLTFDDGPGPYTRQLLDILAEYDVQATFFVMNNDYAYLIGDIVAEGHAIGIHTMCHDYERIYASEEAFFADLYGMQQVIYEQSGVMTTLMRFPGGSSNTVSRFNEGIMTSLTSAVTDAGFQYFDWNVDSDDAGRARSPEVVLENVTEGIGQRQIVIVLQHDIKDYTVEAVEEIILWGLENGYTFLPLDPTSPAFHHELNN